MPSELPNDTAPRSYAAYLAAKKTVDDRALNRHVLSVLRREIAGLQSPTILEIGAGVGTMVARLLEWDILKHADYTLLDVDNESLTQAPRWLGEWATATGRRATELTPGVLQLTAEQSHVTVRTVCSELGDFLSRPADAAQYNVLIANAFLDLIDVPSTLPALFQQLLPHGLFWFSVNFDGETIFLPEHPADNALLAVYHRSMDERVRAGKPAGDSHAGRHLFTHLPAAGARVLAAGSSDWVVHALDGVYPAREAEFVEHILHTIDQELNWRSEVDQTRLQSWLTTRRQQLAAGDLTYIAHQLDFVGRRQ